MGWSYERADDTLRDRNADTCNISRVLKLERHTDCIRVVYNGRKLVDFAPDGTITIWDVGEKRCWGNSISKANELFGWEIYIHCHHDRVLKDRWVARVSQDHSKSVYEFDPYKPMVINPDKTVTGAKVFDRGAEMAEHKRERDEKRAKLRELREDAERQFRQAGLKPKSVTLQIQDHWGRETPVWVRAWVMGQLALHPSLRAGKPDWEWGFTISHTSGAGIYSVGFDPREALAAFRRARKVEDKIGGYITLKKIGVENQELRNQIKDVLFHAA